MRGFPRRARVDVRGCGGTCVLRARARPGRYEHVVYNHQEKTMAKEKASSQAADVHATRPPPDSGGMSTGVAIIGFILCFLAGAAVMWGYDSHRLKTAGGVSAESSGSGEKRTRADSPIRVSTDDPM